MSAEHDSLDRVIDEAARQLTTGNPSAGLTAKVLRRIEQSDAESGVRVSGRRQFVRSPWQIAAGTLALAAVLLLLASRQTSERSFFDRSDRVRTDTATQNRQSIDPTELRETVDSPSANFATTASIPVTPTARLSRGSETFPAIPPIEIRSITLTPIEMPGIEIARLEVSPIRLDPVEAVRQETP